MTIILSNLNRFTEFFHWKILRHCRVVNKQIKKGLLLSLSVNFFKSVNMWQSYKQEHDCLVHFLRLLAMCWPGVQSARDSHALNV